jgi:hypothetical protein
MEAAVRSGLRLAIWSRLDGVVVRAEVTNVESKFLGGREGGRMVITQDSAPALERVFVEFPGALIIAQCAEINCEVVG